MGLKCSPDIAQSIIKSVLCSINDADVYIDNVGAFSNDWDHHLQLLATILHHLCANGFMINLLKWKWVIKETNWLGYWLTQRGLKPWKRKIQAILHMDRPPPMPPNCACSFGASISTTNCGPVAPKSSNL